jgi:hypothetical protein
VEIYPESETAFFYKIVDAQVDFVGPPGANATSLVFHQGGNDMPMPRIDDGVAAQMKAELEARIASNTPQPGTEAALRKMAGAMVAGTPNYEDMAPHIANAVKQQYPHMGPGMKTLGAPQSVQFVRVGEGGWDVYRVKYANGGTLMWRMGLDASGKVSYALVLPDA